MSNDELHEDGPDRLALLNALATQHGFWVTEVARIDPAGGLQLYNLAALDPKDDGRVDSNLTEGAVLDFVASRMPHPE